MPPFLGGGDMIKKVDLYSFTTNALPHKFEAGTPPIAEAVGMGAAVNYLMDIGMENIAKYEHQVGSYTLERLEEIPGIKLFGPDMDKKGAVFSFILPGIHAHDVSQILDTEGIAIRAGHHCAMPLHIKYQIPATARASFYLYNSMDEVDRLVEGIYKVKKIFA
jgi:cysteine desulfurase/selenocysteine lyase